MKPEEKLLQELADYFSLSVKDYDKKYPDGEVAKFFYRKHTFLFSVFEPGYSYVVRVEKHP